MEEQFLAALGLENLSLLSKCEALNFVGLGLEACA